MSATIESLADLGSMELTLRSERLRDRLPELGCDALMVSHLTNVRYLTGFSGSAASLVLLPDEVLFVTDGRYRDQASEQLARSGIEARIEVLSSTADQREVVTTAARGLGRIGLEAEHVSWARQRELASQWFPTAELVPTRGLVEDLRLAKDPGEIDRIAAACAVADLALAQLRHRLLERPTEREMALELDTRMRELGAEGPSFETIVASGPNGAKPHARPSERIIGEGDLVVIDFGALVDGYHSDMTRTFVVGEPSPTQRRMLEVVTESQAAGVEAVGSGVAARTVDAACRDVIDEAGWGDAFLHSTGHGVGLDIHEAPRLATTSDATLGAGNVVTVEPGVYLPEHGGVRLEDTVVVIPDGCRVLTETPKLAPV